MKAIDFKVFTELISILVCVPNVTIRYLYWGYIEKLTATCTKDVIILHCVVWYCNPVA